MRPFRVKAIGFAALVFANIVIALLVTVMTTAPAQSQSVSSNSTTCNDAAFFAAQQSYVDSLSAGALPDAQAVQRARADFAQIIADCYAQLDVDQLRYDDGAMIAPGVALNRDGALPPNISEPDYLLFGNKWGGGSDFNTATNPQIAGGTVYWSYMPTGVSAAIESAGLTITAFSSLPTYQACFETEISNAFAAWQAASNIQFVQIADSGAAAAVNSTAGYAGHIRIGAHTIDGASSVLAHGYYPPPNGDTIAGDLHFDVAENWQCTGGAGKIDIGIVAMHEIGHTIGLNHEPTLLAVMNAFYNSALTTLQTDDINGARALYGNVGTAAHNIADTLTGPYPATKVISGLGTSITDVNVTLTGLYHAYPDDVDVLLVGPAGQAVVLMSDVCGSTAITNMTLTFDDSAATTLPDNSACATGTYRPTNIGLTESFRSPAPTSGYTTTLSSFNGTNPNGTWSLYIIDDGSPDTGGLLNWSLSISAPAAVTNTPSNTPTFTPTATRTFTPSNTPTFTPTATRTFTPSNTPTFTPTATRTFTPSNTPTFTPTFTPTLTTQSLQVSVTLQGRLMPSTGQAVPLAVTITRSGDNSVVFDELVNSDSNGQFTVSGLAVDSYRIRVKHAQTLASALDFVMSIGEQMITIDPLRMGDTDNNNLVNVTDFSLVAAAFGKVTGEVEFDARADFNGDAIINITDFSLLANNFGQIGAN